jgi:hypothetical protein
MRALQRNLLVPLFAAAAIVAGGAATHVMTSAPATHARTAIAGPICPAGTNWDDILQACV